MVVNSVLSPGVRVDMGAVVRDSIVMFDCVIRSGAVIDRAILDKEVVVGQGAIVGDGPDFDRPNKKEPNRLNTGITVVGKRAVIPRGARIGRNVKVASDVRPADFRTRVVRSGESVEVGADRRRGGHRSQRRASRGRRCQPAADVAIVGGGGPPGGRSRRLSRIGPSSARLPPQCHPPNPARQWCARPTSRRWLADLGVEPLERADRDAITSWDLVLDGRRRFDLRSPSSSIRRSG